MVHINSHEIHFYTKYRLNLWVSLECMSAYITLPNTVMIALPINSFGPELPSGPLDDTVKFIFNREIWICYYFATSSGQKGESKKLSAEGVYCDIKTTHLQNHPRVSSQSLLVNSLVFRSNVLLNTPLSHNENADEALFWRQKMVTKSYMKILR